MARLRTSSPPAAHGEERDGRHFAVIRLDVDGADGKWRERHNKLAAKSPPIPAEAKGHADTTVIVVTLVLEEGTSVGPEAFDEAIAIIDRAESLIAEVNDEIDRAGDPDSKVKALVTQWWERRALRDPSQPASRT
jgi:hypothetical protein